jgi:hypothetical protein
MGRIVIGGDMMLKACGCGLSRPTDHPIDLCPRCDEAAYDARFADLRKDFGPTYYLGIDHYSDTIYVWSRGVVAAIEGRLNRMLRYTQTDKLVNELTTLKEENKDLLAENARLRRRLESGR